MIEGYGRIRIRIKVISMHQFTDDKPKCMEYEPTGALFSGFEPLFGS
jgi:hypothetical protein